MTTSVIGRHPSLRLRLTLWIVVIAMVIQLTFSLLILLYQAAALDRIFDQRFQARIDPLIARLSQGVIFMDPKAAFRAAQGDLGTMLPDYRIFGIFNSAGIPVAVLSGAPLPLDALPVVAHGSGSGPTSFRRSLPSPTDSSASLQPWRLGIRRFTDRNGDAYSVLVGRLDSTYESMVTLTRRVIFLTLPAQVIAAGVSAWLIAGLAIAPVRRLREIAGLLSPESLEMPIPATVGAAELESVRTTIEEARERMRHALHARDRFLANVSHELKTPIAIILTEAQTLDRRKLGPDGEAFVRSVIDEMRRLGNTIESFLTITKIRAGKSLMEYSACSVPDLIMDSVLNCSRLARQHKVTLNPLLGEVEVRRPIMGDCDLLRIMLDNLLRNAIRFSPERSQVNIHVTKSAAECTIAVRDFGPGIPEEMLGSLFQPVIQGPNEAGRGRGVGLGLSIAQSIAELHGGTISVANMPDSGCEIAIRIPFTREGPAPDESTTGADLHSPAKSTTGG